MPSRLRLHVQPITMEEESTLSILKNFGGFGMGDLVRAHLGPAEARKIRDSDLAGPVLYLRTNQYHGSTCLT